jgi:sec-independent protein translocase protein TatA
MFDSPWHWIVVAIVALVLFFGWKQLPEMSRSLGRSLRIFKTEIKGMSQDDASRAANEHQEPAQPRELEPGTPPAAPAEPPRAELIKNAEAQRARPRPSPGPNQPG